MKTLCEGFQNPPAEARPFVRWWWSSNRVEPAQLERELDILKKAGIGGVEINPIAAKQRDLKSRVKPLAWRSKQWDEILHFAAREARKRDMIVDLLPGSGWPFGGRFLNADQQIMRMGTVNRKVKGPSQATFDWPEIEQEMRDSVKHGDKGEVDLRFVKIYSAGLEAVDQIADITDRVKIDKVESDKPNGDKGEEGEVLSVDVPEGDYVISFGLFQSGYRYVSGGVLGADGPTMDHYQKRLPSFISIV
jgi:hypothetical protein